MSLFAWTSQMSVPGTTDAWTLIIMLGLGVVTLVCRSFFFLSERQIQLPAWAQRGLQYAPTAALAAVIAPEVLMKDGALVTSVADARIWGAIAAAAYFFIMRRRNPNHSGVLGTIIVGLAVFLPLRLALGW
jgi:branched-subunit amino acid transport protein